MYCFMSESARVIDGLRRVFHGYDGIDIFHGRLMERQYDAEYVSASISIEIGVRPEPLEAIVFQWNEEMAQQRPARFGIAAGILKKGMDPFGHEASYHMFASVIRAVNAHNAREPDSITTVGLAADPMVMVGTRHEADLDTYCEALKSAYDEFAH